MIPLNFAVAGTSESSTGPKANPFANQSQMASVTCAPFSYALGALVAREGFQNRPLQPISAPSLRSEQILDSKSKSWNPYSLASVFSLPGLTSDIAGAV